MSRMAAIIQTTRGGRCGICASDFEPGERQFTHIGGEGHDGFHGRCFLNWLRAHPICPYHDGDVDPSALVPRTERIMAYLKPALENAVYATGIGFIATVVGVRYMAAVEGKATLWGVLNGIGAASVTTELIKEGPLIELFQNNLGLVAEIVLVRTLMIFVAAEIGREPIWIQTLDQAASLCVLAICMGLGGRIIVENRGFDGMGREIIRTAVRAARVAVSVAAFQQETFQKSGVNAGAQVAIVAGIAAVILSLTGIGASVKNAITVAETAISLLALMM